MVTDVYFALQQFLAGASTRLCTAVYLPPPLSTGFSFFPPAPLFADPTLPLEKLAWDAYVDGAAATAVAAGDSVTPSADVVYQITLEDPIVVVDLNVASDGAYAVLLEHNTEELLTSVVSDGNVVLAASFEEGEEDEDEEVENASASVWIQGIVASVVVSLCR